MDRAVQRPTGGDGGSCVDLTCYLDPTWMPLIRPAAHKRDWMEETPDRYAYRCLPLSIANGHGWEICAPVGFRARWHGGKGREAVEIEVDAGEPHDGVPISLFGSGTLTFHVNGLIRTSPGWNLWVGGTPNAAKDGIAPLGGVIETDWSPYTFTMNWRFTRPRNWVRWDKGEPFCFFFPVQRGILDEVRPVMRPMSDAPDIAADYAAWSKSRDDFHVHVERTKPKAPTDQWQKLYYRGVMPDGSPGAADHQSKLRLAPFSAPDGTGPACPVTGAKPAAEPAAPRGPTVAANPLLLPDTPGLVDRDRIDFALRGINFDRLGGTDRDRK